VAFLSLSTLTVKSARTDWALEEARSNARLALMIAIGELQRDLGPDRRVSATAAIYDESEDQPDRITGVQEPHWVGVWDTYVESRDGDNNDEGIKSTWNRDDDRGGLTSNRDAEWDREAEAINYLVSGNEGGRRNSGASNSRFLEPKDDGTTELDEDEKLELVSEDTAGDRGRVSVGKVDTQRYVRDASGVRAPVNSGSYGYWIGDLMRS